MRSWNPSSFGQYCLDVLACRNSLPDGNREVAVGTATLAKRDMDVEMHVCNLAHRACSEIPRFALPLGKPKHHPRPLPHQPSQLELRQRTKHVRRFRLACGHEP